jgi:hypothetical protein
MTALLFFSVGLANETVATRGWTHLLEHIVLRGTEKGDVNFNGAVSGDVTVFAVEGTPEQVVWGLNRLASRFTQISESDMFDEQLIVEAEENSEHSQPSHLQLMIQTAINKRFGLTGPGLGLIHEVGLDDATPAALEQFAAERFRAGSAVLCFDSRPPEGLDFSFPEGRAPAADLSMSIPGDYHHDFQGVAVTGLAPARPGIGTMINVLAQRVNRFLNDHFEISAGLAPPEISLTHEPLSSDLELVGVAAECHPSQAGAVAEVIVRELDTLAQDGATAEEVADQLEAMQQNLEAMDPAAQTRAVATSFLIGHLEASQAAMVKQLPELPRGAVQQAAQALRDTVKIGLPEEADFPAARLPGPVADAALAGTRLKPRFGEGGGSWPKWIITSPEGITARKGPHQVTHRWGDLAAVMTQPGQGRILMRRDGCSVSVEPHAWPKGELIIASIDANVDPSLVVGRSRREPLAKPSNWFSRCLGEAASPLTWARWLAASVIIVGVTAAFTAGFGIPGLALWAEGNKLKGGFTIALSVVAMLVLWLCMGASLLGFARKVRHAFHRSAPRQKGF